METIYNVDYFINKFQAIPEEKWNVGSFSNKSETKFCAYGHCGAYVGECNDWTPESNYLNDIFARFSLGVPAVNDGRENAYRQPTPKQRILAALYDIKAKQQPLEPKEKIKYVTVTVDKAVRELQEETLKLN